MQDLPTRTLEQDASKTNGGRSRTTEYRVITMWRGVFGGWGSESDLQQMLNDQAQTGWRLCQTERAWFLWFWFLPRTKLLLFLERN